MLNQDSLDSSPRPHPLRGKGSAHIAPRSWLCTLSRHVTFAHGSQVQMLYNTLLDALAGLFSPQVRSYMISNHEEYRSVATRMVKSICM